MLNDLLCRGPAPMVLLSAVINASLSLTEVNFFLLSKMTPKADGLIT